jgi:hypothetical protein
MLPPASKLLTLETRVAVVTTVSFVVLATSLLLAFRYNRSECWWLVKISTGLAALGAVILVIVNIVLHGNQ